MLLFGPATAMLAAAAPAGARAFSYNYKTNFAQFGFSWSAEAAAIPALSGQLHKELATEKAKTIQGGKDEFALRRKMGSEGLAWASSTKITTEGDTPRLLSLGHAYWSFTGGAHGNGATTGLLWDRKLERQLKFGDLFLASRRDLAALRQPYCRALDRERRKRRGSDAKIGRMVSEFDSCPKFSELALIPADPRHRGRFDTIHVIAAPYVAGPYAEGDYDIRLPVTEQLISGVKAAYRSSFAVQRQ